MAKQAQPVTITDGDEVIISPPKPQPNYKTCKECGTKLVGGEASGSEANGYCDSCNL